MQQQGDLAEALRLGEASLALYRALGDHLGLARALKTCGWAALSANNLVLAQQLFEESAARFRAIADFGGVALALLAHAKVVQQAGDRFTAAAYVHESLAIFRRIEHPEGIAGALFQQGELAALHGEYHRATQCISEALAYNRIAGQRLEIVWVEAALGELYLLQFDLDAARPLITATLHEFETLGISEGIATQLHLLAQIERREGRLADARAYYCRCLMLAQQADYGVLVARCLAGLGALALAQGDYQQGATLLRVAFTQFAVLPDVLTPADWSEYDLLRQRVRDMLGEAALANEAQTVTLEAAVAYASA